MSVAPLLLLPDSCLLVTSKYINKTFMRLYGKHFVYNNQLFLCLSRFANLKKKRMDSINSSM